MWRRRFKKEWKLSTQRIKVSRVTTNVASEEEIDAFLNTFAKLKKKIDRRNIFNYDETSYNLINPPKTAIREVGSLITKLNVIRTRKVILRWD